ncbi:MAG: response regulator [Acidobacteria bacterium]|nr:response regulator [Acidobacteriota bacterium]
MAQLLELTVSHRAQLSIEAAEGLPAVDADATQIRQVVMNLILNAAEAIGDGGGEIRVVTRTVTLDGQADVGNVAGGELGGGIYVSIDVHDTGCGMTDEVRARIFDPFYSTKFHGRGLGLAAVVGIVRSHRGGLLVRSDPGLGSCFSVMLPASARAAMPAEADSAPRQSFSWTGTALVVDDEPAVRDLAARMLGRLGFTVVVAIDGVDGLARLDEDGISPRVVVLDLTMPRMNGEETLRGLRGRGLMMPVIMASGYHESDITGRVEGLDPVLFLHKPFTVRQLHDALHRLLDAPSAGGGTAGAPRGQSTA